jgi:anti-sigma B factor antagonist
MSASDGVQAECTFEYPYSGCVIVHITGELDAASAPDAEALILKNVPKNTSRVVVDLTDVQFIDSTGIRLLIQVLLSKQADSELIVVKPRSRSPRRALEIVGLARVIRIVETLSEALDGGISGSNAA